jgi:hypothetical protein
MIFFSSSYYYVKKELGSLTMNFLTTLNSVQKYDGCLIAKTINKKIQIKCRNWWAKLRIN